MVFILELFRSSKPGRPKAARTRRAWSRRGRSKSVAVSLPDSKTKANIQTGAPDANSTPAEPTVNWYGSSDAEEKPLNSDGYVLDESAPAPKEDCASEVLSRSQQGSKRLGGLRAFLYPGKASESDSLSCVSNHTELQDAASKEAPVHSEGKEVPVHSEEKEKVSASLSQKTSASRRDCDDEKRKVSSRTVSSHESGRTSETICRHPPPSAPTVVDELHADWLNWTHEPAAHCTEGSDPFSDSKGAAFSVEASRSSERSEDHSRKEDADSVAGQPEVDVVQHPPSNPSSGTHDTSRITSSNRTSSAGSQISRTSQVSRLDPCKATAAFNQLAAKLNLQLSIPVDDPPVAASSEDRPSSTGDNGGPRRRQGLLSRVRPARSTLTLKATPPPDRQLRRTKTFASLGRRPVPMSSLQGKSVETLARLGGHSYLMPLTGLAPFPLQLPAFIVATVMFLRKYACSTPNVFVEPGDIKAAARLYEHFASQVLSAEKDEPKIAITMRVVAMPHFEDPATAGALPVLSVGWVLKTLLAGLPRGILGSVRLYQTLSAIYFVSEPTQAFPRTMTCFGALPPTTSPRVQLIALAITALASEMQCALICAVFGLLTGLAREPEAMHEHQPQGPGTGLRAQPVADQPTLDGLARVFGPLLLGIQGRAAQDGAGGRVRAQTRGGCDYAAAGVACTQDVEQEIEEQRVAELLLQNWANVSRQLRRWARSGYSTRAAATASLY